MQTSVDLGELRARLETRVPAFIDDLRELVDIDSGTDDKEGVDRVGGLLRAHYRRLGGQIDVYSSELSGDAFSVAFSGDGSGRVLLLGHMDTVYPRGTVGERPFRVDGDRIIGPGTADMKAGDLAIVYALEALLEVGWKSFAQVEVVHNADEEIGSRESRDLIRERSAGADAVLVLEAGRENGDIVSARKGIAKVHLHVHGRSAHAGVNHDLGRSAALEMAHKIVALEALNGTIPGVTLNVGTVRSGGRSNVVPEYAFADVDVRAPEIEELEQVLAVIRGVVAGTTVEGTIVELHTEIEHYPMHRSAPSALLVDLARRLAGELGFTVSDTATGGASDGNTAASIGRPVLDGLGPVGGAAHSPNEYILVSSIADRVALLAGLIAAIGEGSAA